MTQIIVRIERDEFLMLRHPEMFEWICLQKLREAGVPVKGVLFFRGVVRGELSSYHDKILDNLVFRWTGGELPK